jgi:hypothetical protein
MLLTHQSPKSAGAGSNHDRPVCVLAGKYHSDQTAVNENDLGTDNYSFSGKFARPISCSGKSSGRNIEQNRLDKKAFLADK